MEIERKWMVKDWPQNLELLYEQLMRQGYISVRPTVRIREEAMIGGETEYVLCFKSAGLLARKEIEINVDPEKFAELEDLIGKPLIPKLRRTFALPDGLKLEVSHVDEGQPSEFWYAEVEFESEAQALSWTPESVGLAEYLNDEVTHKPGQSMGEFWVQTRMLGNAKGFN